LLEGLSRPNFGFVLQPGHRRSFPFRVSARALALLRLLAFILGLQVTGAGDAAVHAVSLVLTAPSAHEEECPLEGPCRDCAPGCPNCHCTNALTSVVPEVGVPGVVLPVTDSASNAPIAEREPLVPDRSALFRPPRAAAVTS
jgi:hypothetical protein